MKGVVLSVKTVDILNVFNMPKYLLHVPVFGSLDLTVEADSEEEVLEEYLKQKDELLQFHGQALADEMECSYVVKLREQTKC